MGAWLKIFALTYAVETPIYAAGLRGRMRVSAALLLSLLLNLATHPVVWFVLPGRFANLVHYALFAEGFAVTVEAVLLRLTGRLRESWRNGWLWCFGLAFVANAASVLVGELLYFALAKLGLTLV